MIPDDLAPLVGGPEKAGVAGSIPSLATEGKLRGRDSATVEANEARPDELQESSRSITSSQNPSMDQIGRPGPSLSLLRLDRFVLMRRLGAAGRSYR
jgi:hypothetical protein